MMTVVLWLAMVVGWLIFDSWGGAVVGMVLTLCYYFFVAFFVPEPGK